MYLFVVAVHIVLSVLLILVILLQPGKGGDVGSAFGGGGGGSSLFGPRGPASLLAQATTFVAVGFMFTSITLAYFSNLSLLDDSNVADTLEEREAARLKKEQERAAAAATPPAGDQQAAPSDGEAAPIELDPVVPAAGEQGEEGAPPGEVAPE